MLVSVVNLKCSNCGESLSESMMRCPSCDQPVVVRNVSSLLGLNHAQLSARRSAVDRELMGRCDGSFDAAADFTVGCCLLRLKMYEQSIERLARAISTDPYNVESLFCSAIAALRGRKAFVTPLADLRQAQKFIEAAILIDERPIFRFFLAYIKQDFYDRRCLKIEPNWRWEFQRALSLGLGADDRAELFDLLGQACPEILCGASNDDVYHNMWTNGNWS